MCERNTSGLILNHKRALISEIRASVRGRLDQFKELIRMIPFVVTIAALVLFSVRAQRVTALRGLK